MNLKRAQLKGTSLIIAIITMLELSIMCFVQSAWNYSVWMKFWKEIKRGEIGEYSEKNGE